MTRLSAAALLLAAALLTAQDDAARVRDWCDKLGDENPRTRDEAQKQLIKLGPAAIPALKETAEKSSDPEVRDRARKAVEEIARAEKLEKVYQQPKRVTVDFKATPLRDVTEELARQSGLHVSCSGQNATPITLKLADAPLLQVLDEISHQLKDCSFKFTDEKTVALSTDRFLPYPTAYSSAFRLRVTRIEKQVTNSFDKVTGEVRLSLSTDWEKSIKPLETFQVDIVEAVDDQNRKLALQERNDEAEILRKNVNFRRMNAAVQQPQPQETWATFPDVDPSIKSLHKIRARGTFRFPLDIQQVTFTDPVAGAEKVVGEYTVKIQSVDRNYIMINVQCKSDLAAQNMSETFDFGSFEIVDKGGTVTKTEVASSGIIDQKTYQFYAMTRRVAVKEFRFNLREIVSKTFDFEFDELPLPQ